MLRNMQHSCESMVFPMSSKISFCDPSPAFTDQYLTGWYSTGGLHHCTMVYYDVLCGSMNLSVSCEVWLVLPCHIPSRVFWQGACNHRWSAWGSWQIEPAQTAQMRVGGQPMSYSRAKLFRFSVASQKAWLPSCHSSTPCSAIPWAKNIQKMHGANSCKFCKHFGGKGAL